jgi:hypothetical protein
MKTYRTRKMEYTAIRDISLKVKRASLFPYLGLLALEKQRL